MICNNCGAEVQGKYCANCGQKNSTKRLTINGLFHDSWHAVTHTDKGLLRLLNDLVFHPKQFYENYFAGQRKKYFSPVLFFILTAGFVALIYGYIFSYQDEVLNTYNEFGKKIYHATKFRALLILPFQIFLTWLAFKKYYNLAEITVFWLFALGLSYVMTIVISPVYFPLIKHKDTIDFIVVYLSYSIILWQAVVLFGKNYICVLLVFVIINLSMILDMVASLYVLFGANIFDNSVGINDVWDLIRRSYY